MEERPRSADEYHTARWTLESKAFKIAHPLCSRCAAKGIVKESEVTDHKIPPEIYGDFWDQINWDALCKRCNIDKGNEDKKLIQKFRNENR